MEVSIDYHKQFVKDAKRLSKKYPSFKSDLQALTAELKKKPDMGIDLGNGVRKVRMAITSKGRGKSGGARIISYQDLLLSEEDCLITLLTVYDKSDTENVSDSFIRSLIETAD